MRTSKQARIVIEHLNALGIFVRDAFDLEVACSQFFPGHINGVIDGCLKGGSQARKLMRAQELGWQYFNTPVYSYLGGRGTAHRPEKRNLDLLLPWARGCWKATASSFLVHDMNREEADILLFEIPHLCDKASLFVAMQACKDRDARSVHYLRGVLTRERARRSAPVEERDRDEARPWEPPEVVGTADVADWDAKLSAIESIKGMRDGKTKRR